MINLSASSCNPELFLLIKRKKESCNPGLYWSLLICCVEWKIIGEHDLYGKGTDKENL